METVDDREVALMIDIEMIPAAEALRMARDVPAVIAGIDDQAPARNLAVAAVGRIAEIIREAATDLPPR